MKSSAILYTYVLNNPLKFTDPSGYTYFNSNNADDPSNKYMDWLTYWDNQWLSRSFDWGGVEETANLLFDVGKNPFGITKRNGVLGVWIDYTGKEEADYNGTQASDGTRFETQAIIGSKFYSLEELYGGLNMMSSSEKGWGRENQKNVVSSREALTSTLVLAGSISKIPHIGIVALGAGLLYTAYLYFKEAKLPPIPKYTYEYRHPSQNPINNQPKPPNFNPGEFGKAVKWTAGIGFASWLAKNIYDTHMQSEFSILQNDKTKVVNPAVIPIND
jgi:hypothetical protein